MRKLVMSELFDMGHSFFEGSLHLAYLTVFAAGVLIAYVATKQNVLADISWNWMFVDILWVHDSLRHRGIGTRLMELAEEKARERGCQYAYLDTFSFQACPFYERLGYEVFGILDDFPNGHKRYFMKKSLHTFQERIKE